MKNHDLTKLSHHVWETQSRVNLHCKAMVSEGDTLTRGVDAITVIKINKAEESNKGKGLMFYEVDVISC